MDVAFRADASPEIGTGHLMRCLTLADAVAQKGAGTLFLCAPAAEPWRGLVESRGHRFTILSLHARDVSVESTPPHAAWAPWGQVDDASATLDALAAPVDWVVVDHYALDAHWERAVKPKARRILAIDDLADRDHDCDALLDHNPQDEAGNRYDGRLPAHARRLIGPRYALLRPEFAAAREKRCERDGSVRRIAVFMGGTDPDGATLLAIEALSSPPLKHIPVDVAIGSASPHLGAIRAAAERHGNAIVHVDLPSLADLFSRADLAVGAGGVAALERCCVGLPTVTMAIADNQKRGLEWLGAHGAVRYMGVAKGLTTGKLADCLVRLCATPDRVRALDSKAAELVDGGGTRRIVSAMLAETDAMVVRAATMRDAELLHRWRNTDSVRTMFFSTQPVAYDDHCRWLSATLADPDRVVLIGLAAGQAVGSVRFEIEGGRASVSVTVAPQCQGRGLGRALLKSAEAYLRKAWHDPLVLEAAIKPENTASIRLFAGAGFTLIKREPARLLYAKEL